MSTLIEKISSLTIGSVEFVSPSEIKVLLELDAPQATALNTGIPSGFPRINGYVLVPNEIGAVVGMIVWLGVERSTFPKRTGLKDFGLVDLPFPLRKMSITPVGTLVSEKSKDGEGYRFRLRRGISVFPCVGDSVVLPTAEQLLSIIESQGPDRRVPIGTSPLAANAVVSVDPDKMFGRHLAVLGNTGSGKSCSVAGLIRWSLEKAAQERSRCNREGAVNARFIILDPNGEYTETFSDLGASVRIFKVPPVEDSGAPLAVPAWMWNSEEWCAFANAAPAAQRPVLLQGLRDMRAGATLLESVLIRVTRLMRSYRARIQQMIAEGVSGYTGYRNSLACGNFLRNMATDAEAYVQETVDNLRVSLDDLSQAAQSVANARHWGTPPRQGFNDFSETDLLTVLSAIETVLENLPHLPHVAGPSEDAPIPFEVNHLADHLEFLASNVGAGQVGQFVATLTMRIRMMLADRRLGPIVAPETQMTFEEWLTSYIGANSAVNGQIAILDLSLVSPDVLHVVIAVVARLIFEAVQRFRKFNTVELPTVLILEEAHTFIQRGSTGQDHTATPTEMCRRTFERIAREGRKFGLGLVLSSQRPSELSPTVLAQCNTFLLHRMVNDRDQELVSRLVPDNLGGLLRELPSLPTRQAVLLGWASVIPILVEIKELPESHRPRSSDPKFWDVWTGAEERTISWEEIAADWTS